MSRTGLWPYTLVAIGGAVGSALRYHAAVIFGARPFTTFLVNITGAFLIGVLTAVTSDTRLRLLVGTGILGGFTTFSAWQLEALVASRSRTGQLEALLILFGSLAAGFSACWAGYASGQRLR